MTTEKMFSSCSLSLTYLDGYDKEDKEAPDSDAEAYVGLDDDEMMKMVCFRRVWLTPCFKMYPF